MKSDRLLAMEVLKCIQEDQGSLSTLLHEISSKNPDANLSLIREYTYGVCRWFHRLNFFLSQLIEKPLRKKDLDVHSLLLLGLYQLYYMRTPDHATINETVELTRKIKKDWARKLVNGVLRSAQRQQADLEKDADKMAVSQFSHPLWLVESLEKDWPDDYAALMAENNIQAPMTLRLNIHRGDRKSYLAALEKEGIEARPGVNTETAIILAKPANVTELPGFDEGWVSVQDEASQIAAALLDPAPGTRVLDACAAPGGKTCAILENNPGIRQLIALDNSEERLVRVRENLTRLDLEATVTCADAGDPDSWWDGAAFNTILLDAPCSGTGVIRRHPDIKLLRQAHDISRLVQLQQHMLSALWPCLEQGGRLLYSTCSVLKAENSDQIVAFLASTTDARAISLSHPAAQPCSVGMQFLPGADGMDGFFYALLEKI